MATVLTTPTTPPATRSGRRGIRPLTSILAAIAAVIVWGVAKAGGVDLRQPSFNHAAVQPLQLVAVVSTALAAGLAGWGLLALVERFGRRPRRLWTIVASAFLVLSLSGPFSGSGVTSGDRATLLALHLAVGAVVLSLLRPSASEASARSTVA